MPHSEIRKEDLAKYYHLPIAQVAGELGVCATMLKKLCRKHGIQRWPHRKIQSLNNMIQELESSIAKGDLPEEMKQIRLEELGVVQAKKKLIMEDPNADVNIAHRGLLSSLSGHHSASHAHPPPPPPDATEQELPATALQQSPTLRIAKPKADRRKRKSGKASDSGLSPEVVPQQPQQLQLQQQPGQMLQVQQQQQPQQTQQPQVQAAQVQQQQVIDGAVVSQGEEAVGVPGADGGPLPNGAVDFHSFANRNATPVSRPLTELLEATDEKLQRFRSQTQPMRLVFSQFWNGQDGEGQEGQEGAEGQEGPDDQEEGTEEDQEEGQEDGQEQEGQEGQEVQEEQDVQEDPDVPDGTEGQEVQDVEGQDVSDEQDVQDGAVDGSTVQGFEGLEQVAAVEYDEQQGEEGEGEDEADGQDVQDDEGLVDDEQPGDDTGDIRMHEVEALMAPGSPPSHQGLPSNSSSSSRAGRVISSSGKVTVVGAVGAGPSATLVGKSQVSTK